jgi:hypothetical protein
VGQRVREKGAPEKVRNIVVPAHRCLHFFRATLLPRSMSVKVNRGQEKNTKFSSMASTPARHPGWLTMIQEIKSAAKP